MLIQHKASPENTLQLKDPGFRSGLPHPTSYSAKPLRCRHGPGSVSCASLQVCFCSWMESLPAIHWQGLNKGQQNPREEEEICWPHFKDWLKNIWCFFPLDSYVSKGTVKKENLFFLRALFAVLWSLKRPQIQRLPQLYIFQGGLCLTLAKVISLSAWIRAEWTISVTSFHRQLHMLYNA